MGPKTRQHHRVDRSHPLRYLRLKLAMRAWALWVPVLALGKDLKPLLARTSPGQGTPYAGLSAETVARCCHKAARHPILMADRPCLREGLLLNRFLLMAGFSPTLHFGIDRTSLNSPRARAHCWIELDGRVFNPPAANIVEIWTHRDDLGDPGGNAAGRHDLGARPSR
jgi:hypothetical protein